MRAGNRRWTRRAAQALVAGTVAVAGFGLAPAPAAEAAGVTTHAWMALTAIDHVQDPQLKALLLANREMVRSGGTFPDSGYTPGVSYGEEAHWQRYADARIDRLRTRESCGDLTDPTGPCAGEIAHTFGMMGHGMGDEAWDWLFEPYSPDLDEYYLPPDFGSFGSEGGQELQMDLVAIARHGQPTTELLPSPNKPELVATFEQVGFTDVDVQDLGTGDGGIRVAQLGEAFWAPRHIDALEAAMPWMSHNIVTAPGGIDWAAVAIAGYWDTMWGRLMGDQPATEVSITYPADGERRVPAAGWKPPSPGSARDRGGARTRITAALTYARPYEDQHSTPGDLPEELPAGAMTLTEVESGDPVPTLAGYPRSVPYGSESGHHLVNIQPAADLEPCTWYRVDITEDLIDANDLPVVPHTWEFRTGLDALGSRCPDDPYSSDENFLRKLTADLLDRSATEEELQEITYRFARGLTRRAHTAATLAAPEVREAIVRDVYQQFLDRDPDPSGLAYWSQKLLTIPIVDLQARVASSAEVYRKAGGTNAAYVADLYQRVFGRAVDPSGAAFWKGRLDRGLGRHAFAKALLTSPEESRSTVREAYQHLLDRAPDPSGLAYWSGVLQRGADARRLWEQIILSSEYDRKAQQPPVAD